MKRPVFTALAAVLVVTGCTERLENDVGCPILCPREIVDIETTTIDAIVLDTTVIALEAPGSAPLMLLATRGDTLDTRVVVRFDAVPPRYQPVAGDTATAPIEEIHDAILRLRITTADGVIPQVTTIEAYNVDAEVPDTAFTALLPFFTPDRLLGSLSIPRDSLLGRDSVRVPLDGPALLSVLQASERLRVGLRVTGTGSAQLHVFALESGLPAMLSFRPAADTAVPRQFAVPHSLSPDDPPELRFHLADFMILARVPPPGLPTDLNVGGLPARRSYLRFSIPRFIIDSTTVVRASLLLTQRPNPAFPVTDTMGIGVHLVLAGVAVTDLARAATLTADPEVTGVDTLFTAPAASGVRSVDIAQFVRFWRGVDTAQTPHAIVLVSTREGGSPLEARFYSTDAAPELRPRLRISYSPRQPPGLP
jgi:hypothetical protein